MPRNRPSELANSVDGASSRHLYNTICVLKYFMNRIDPGSSWHLDLPSFLKGAPVSYLKGMETPVDWEVRPLWR